MEHGTGGARPAPARKDPARHHRRARPRALARSVGSLRRRAARLRRRATAGARGAPTACSPAAATPPSSRAVSARRRTSARHALRDRSRTRFVRSTQRRSERVSSSAVRPCSSRLHAWFRARASTACSGRSRASGVPSRTSCTWSPAKGRIGTRLESSPGARVVGDAVRFVGAVADDELPLWYSLGDVFVMPSRSEPPERRGIRHRLSRGRSVRAPRRRRACGRRAGRGRGRRFGAPRRAGRPRRPRTSAHFAPRRSGPSRRSRPARTRACPRRAHVGHDRRRDVRCSRKQRLGVRAIPEITLAVPRADSSQFQRRACNGPSRAKTRSVGVVARGVVSSPSQSPRPSADRSRGRRRRRPPGATRLARPAPGTPSAIASSGGRSEPLVERREHEPRGVRDVAA